MPFDCMYINKVILIFQTGALYLKEMTPWHEIITNVIINHRPSENALYFVVPE